VIRRNVVEMVLCVPIVLLVALAFAFVWSEREPIETGIPIRGYVQPAAAGLHFPPPILHATINGYAFSPIP
jgi:hypothetical protein